MTIRIFGGLIGTIASIVWAATLAVNGGVKPGHVAEQKWATLVR